MATNQAGFIQGQDPYIEAPPDDRHVLASQWCVGATLRSAREAGGESLDEVAEAIRIRSDYLHAIEEENYYGLPGWAHAVGYVRSYAMYLGLDTGPMVKRVRDQLALREHVFEQQGVERSRNFMRVISMGGMAVLAGTVGFGLWFTAPAESVTEFLRPVPDRIISFIDRSLNTGSPVAGVTKSDALPAAAPPSIAPPTISPAIETAQPASQPAFAPIRIASVVMAPASSTARGVLVLNPLPRHAIDRGSIGVGQLTLRALKDVWFRVEDRQGGIVTERQMGRGEVQRLPDVRDLVIATRDGGAIEYYVDGTFAGVLGDQGQTVQGLSLAKLAEQPIGG